MANRALCIRRFCAMPSSPLLGAYAIVSIEGHPNESKRTDVIAKSVSTEFSDAMEMCDNMPSVSWGSKIIFSVPSDDKEVSKLVLNLLFRRCKGLLSFGGDCDIGECRIELKDLLAHGTLAPVKVHKVGSDEVIDTGKLCYQFKDAAPSVPSLYRIRDNINHSSSRKGIFSKVLEKIQYHIPQANEYHILFIIVGGLGLAFFYLKRKAGRTGYQDGFDTKKISTEEMKALLK